MNITETLNEGLKRSYNVTISAEIVDARYNDEAQKISLNLKLPGFREGKVPLHIVKKQYHSKIISTILQDIIEENTVKLFKDKNINPVEQPKIDIESYENNKDLVYKISVETFPEITIPNIDDIEVENVIYEINDQHIDKTINELAKNNKEYTEVSTEAATEGMAVLIDYEGKIDGVPFEGGKGENFTLALGSKTFIPGFEDQLIGCKKDDQKTIKVTFPKDYHSKDFAGKEAEFQVNVKDVLSSRQANIDDDFAKKFGLPNLEDLRSSIKSKLENDMKEITKTSVRKHLFDALETKCDFMIPQTIADKEFESISDNYKNSSESKSIDSEESNTDNFRKLAERRVKLGMLIAEIGKDQKIQITQSDIREAMLKQARMFAGQENIVIDYYKKNPKSLEALKGPILEDKVVDYILTKVKIKERKASADELLKIQLSEL